MRSLLTDIRIIISKKLNLELKNLRNNFISLVILRAGNYIIPIITIPYLVKVLGIEIFGLIAFAEMVIMYFKSIVDYGFDLTGTRSISENRSNKVKLNELVNTIYGVKFILLFFSFIVFSILLLIVPSFNNNWLLFLFTFGIVIGNFLLPIWFFQGVEKMKYITIINFISKLIYVFLLFIFVKEVDDFYFVPLLNSIGLVVGGLISIYLMITEFGVKFKVPMISAIKIRAKEDFNIFISRLAPNLYNNSMGVLLGFFVGNVQVGYYAAATKLIEVGRSILEVITITIFPYLNRKDSYRKQLLGVILFTGLTLSIFFFLFSSVLIKLLFDENMETSIVILKILSLSPLFMAFIDVFGTNTLILKKKDKLVRNIIVTYSILGFILGFILIPLYGSIGAAIILVGIRGLIGVTDYFFTLEIKHKNINSWNYLRK